MSVFGSVNTRDPVNRQSRLAHRRLGWWLALPHNSGGGFLYDLTGQRHGTLVNMTTAGTTGWVAEHRTGSGTLKYLASASSRVTLSTARTIGGNDTWTASAWVQTTASSSVGGRPVYCERGSAGNDILKIDSLDTTSTTQAILTYRNDAASIVQVRGATAINDGARHHIVITKDAAQNLSLYVDGKLDVGSTTFVGANPNNFTDATVQTWLGADLGGGTGAWDGLISDVAVYDRDLGVNEVRELFLEGLTGYPTLLNRVKGSPGPGTGGGTLDADYADEVTWSDSFDLAPGEQDTLSWTDAFLVEGVAAFEVTLADTVEWEDGFAEEPWLADALEWADDNDGAVFFTETNYEAPDDDLRWLDRFTVETEELANLRYRR